MDLIQRDVAKDKAHALKIKVGGLMFNTADINAIAPAGRTEKIIPLIRQTFGDKMVLYADANGFYSVEEAIRVGKLLEEYRFEFFEEPVAFDWYEETIKVQAIDGDKRQITLARPTVYGIKQGNPAPRRYRALNVLEELDQPGEFFVDRVSGRLYF